MKVGAGISTGAGIPDFRSPETGLYANLERLDLPYPEAVFDISYFRKKPKAFYTLAHELYPGKFEPTDFHKFMKLVDSKGYLHRVFTQNIDTLERLAGIPDEKMVEAHGSFANNHCIECEAEMSQQELKDIMWKDGTDKVNVPRCKNKSCKAKGGGLVKPDITFFGESLPSKFFDCIHSDLPHHADLVIIAGTSLTVSPFAHLPEMVDDSTVRVLFNLERVGDLGTKENDVLMLGDCDEQINKFVELCGWSNEFSKLEEEEEPQEVTKDESETVEEIVEDLSHMKLKDDDQPRSDQTK